MKKYLTILLIIITITSCKDKEIDWNEVDKIVIYENCDLNFSDIDINTQDSLCIGNELDLKLAIPYFKKSKYETKNYIYKGGSYKAVILFKDNTQIKIALSMIYGVFKEIETGNSYIIEGDNKLRTGRWQELYK